MLVGCIVNATTIILIAATALYVCFHFSKCAAQMLSCYRGFRGSRFSICTHLHDFDCGEAIVDTRESACQGLQKSDSFRVSTKGLGPYGGARFFAEDSSRHAEQDEAAHDDDRMPLVE